MNRNITDGNLGENVSGNLEGLDNMVKIFLLAASSVSKDYLVYREAVGNHGNSVIEHLERVFSYELYHKWSILLECLGLRDQGWIINAEISKHLDWFYTADNELNQIREKTDFRFPDMVLHKGQDNQEDNRIVCEVKRGYQITDENLKKDLYKLCRFVTKDSVPEGKITSDRFSNPFNYGIFVCLNGKTKEKSFFNDVCCQLEMQEDTMKRILCVDVTIKEEHDNVCIEYYTLYDIITSNINSNM